jgi:ribonuclease HII
MGQQKVPSPALLPSTKIGTPSVTQSNTSLQRRSATARAPTGERAPRKPRAGQKASPDGTGAPLTTERWLIGVDENGLGARLGPMLVTAVMAQASPAGQHWLRRPLPKDIRVDLDDSKRLVKFGEHQLAEAWARALFPEAKTPRGLLAKLTLRPVAQLQRRCPPTAQPQCWNNTRERFDAPASTVARLSSHLKRIEARGVRIVRVKSEILCTAELNQEREAGGNRFVSDLHAMERLICALGAEAPQEVLATCGKVGGIGRYERFFGPLSDRVRLVLREERRHSAYRFPGLGELHFVQDADAHFPLVMLASLVGKYLRELTMGRISHFYSNNIHQLENVSGYHDPRSARFVQLSRPHRRKLAIPDTCFERSNDV